jgi:hypothetical protein
MNTPTPNTPPAGQPKRPVLVVPRTSKRDILIAIAIAIAVLGFVTFAIYSTGTDKPKNTISGIITGRRSTGERETQLNVSRQGVKEKAIDTGYYLKVFVKEDNRTYEVTVEKDLWQTKKDGDRLDFLRPPSEQSY